VKVLLAWCSRTGTTAAAAARSGSLLEGWGHEVTEAPIVPRWDLPYPVWLLLSFVPGSRVPLMAANAAQGWPDPGACDRCLLALPKWTFSCPPVNEYLARFGPRLPPTALLVTCGGWDQDRYLESLARRLQAAGAPVLGTLALRRRLLEDGTAHTALRHFLLRAFPPV
jgi:hypothetical protein